MKQFRIDERHLALFKRMNVRWDDMEFGAPAIDPKRPYGNGDVVSDMLELLGRSSEKIDGEYIPVAICIEMGKLHKEMELALQICLVSQTFEVGLYEQTREYSYRSWAKISP